MKLELEQELVKKYPSIFQFYRGDPKDTCMAWGMSHSDGWYHLLDQLCSDIMKICDKYGVIFIAEQVKEKFGGLRFYYHLNSYGDTKTRKVFRKIDNKIMKIMCRNKLYDLYWKLTNIRMKIYSTPDEKIETLIRHAEHDSFHICEECGNPGKVRTGGWVRTLCDKHWEEMSAAR